MRHVPNRPGKQWLFALAAVLVHAILAVIPLTKAGWDVLHFVVAGSRFVDRSRLVTPIEVRDRSDGYDGQFYYRLAIDPDAHAASAYGITLDVPAWRMQRIGYPFTAYLLSAGFSDAVATVLFLINLAGIGLIAFVARHLQHRYELPGWFSWGLLAWPGFFITLTHDTTEILALVLLMVATSSYLAGRTTIYALFAALTCLTRETSLLLFGGIALYEATVWMRSPTRTGFLRTLSCGASALPFLAWRQFLIERWGVSPQEAGGYGNIGAPFGGMASTLCSSLEGAGPVLGRIVMVAAVLATAGAGLVAALQLPALWRAKGCTRPLLVGWVPLAALLTTMTARWPDGGGGPWVDTTSVFRAYSEYWFITLLLLAFAGVRLPRWSAIPAVLVWGVAVGIAL